MSEPGVEISREGILKALSAQSDFSYSDAGPPWDLGVTEPGPMKGQPRVTNGWVAELVAENGEWTWNGKWLNAFTGEPEGEGQ